jgi:hypothetical protein
MKKLTRDRVVPIISARVCCVTEKLIDQVGLGAHAAVHEKLHEHVRELMFLVHDADHLILHDFERDATVEGGGCGQSLRWLRRKRGLAGKVARGKHRDCGLFTGLRNHGDLCAAVLKIEDGVGRISLREEMLLLVQFDDSSAKAAVGKKSGQVEVGVALNGRLHSTSFEAFWVRNA